MGNNDSQKDGEQSDAGQIAPRLDVKSPAREFGSRTFGSRTFGSRTFGSFSLASSSGADPGGPPISGNGPDAAGCSRR